MRGNGRNPIGSGGRTGSGAHTGRGGRAAWLALCAGVALSAVLSAGCLGDPEIEDTWTRVDMDGVTLSPDQPLTVGSRCSVSVHTRITYRAIVTGFVITELRASTIPPSMLGIGPTQPRLRMATDIDNLLANSVTMGRATRAITGWNHLIQRLDQSFSGSVPATIDTTGSSAYLFLVSYLGEGEEVEQPDGSDSLVVTPFISTEMEILPIGMPIAIGSTVP
ncbi:MAG: hypothetical protein ACREOU_10970 [Candidatus Eiseniibacteriota bacterium]